MEQVHMSRTRGKIHRQSGQQNEDRDVGNDQENDQNVDGETTSPATWDQPGHD